MGDDAGTARRAADLARALFFARVLLGLLFLMAGWHKVFEMGAVTHARKLFVSGYAGSWIPVPVLWGLGVAVPFVELAAGLLLVAGWRTREALVAVGLLLLMVTYGHLLSEPFYDITTHILPRAALVVVLLALPREADRWSVDGWLAARREGRGSPGARSRPERPAAGEPAGAAGSRSGGPGDDPSAAGPDTGGPPRGRDDDASTDRRDGP